MSYVLQIQAAQARVKAALIDLLVVTSDGGANGDFDGASASIEVDDDGQVNGSFDVGRVLPSGDLVPSAGGSL